MRSRGLEDGAVAVAVGWVLVGGASRHAAEEPAGLCELVDAVVDVGEVLVDEVGDVSARGFAVVRDCEDLPDLCERESGGLGVADEAQPVDDVWVVVSVARRRANRIGENSRRFPEADGLVVDAAVCGELSDAHTHDLLDLPLHWRVYGNSQNATTCVGRNTLKVQLLYFDDCPNWKITDERLGDVARCRGLEVQHRLVATPEEAEAARFRGSPTILVDGEDPFASGDEPFGFACRVYRTPAGPAGSPTAEQLEAVIDA